MADLMPETLFGIALAGVCGIAALVIAFRYPEVTFVLFINAGVFKVDPRLESISHLADLTIGFELLCALGIAWQLVFGQLRASRMPRMMALGYFALAVTAVTSRLYTPAPVYGTDKLLRLLLITLFACFAAWLLFQDERRRTRLYISWVGFSSLATVNAMSGRMDAGRIEFRNAYDSSGYLGFAAVAAQGFLICLFFLLPLAGTWRARMAVTMFLALNCFGMLIAGGRAAPGTALIVVGIAGVVTAVRIFNRASQRRAKREDVTLGRTIALASVVIALIFVFAQQYFVTLLARAAVLYSETELYTYERLDMFRGAFEALLTHPQGLGIGGFSVYYFGNDARGGFPHNLVLEVACELGWIGVISFLLACYYPVSKVCRRLHHLRGVGYSNAMTTVILMLFMFLYFQVHGDINDARCLFAWSGALFSLTQDRRLRAVRVPRRSARRPDAVMEGIR